MAAGRHANTVAEWARYTDDPGHPAPDLGDAVVIRRRIDELIDLERCLWDEQRVEPLEHELLVGIRAELDACWSALRRRQVQPASLEPVVKIKAS